MTARVLVVDDVLANVRLLEAKLTAEYFEVFTAMNGADALEVAQRSKPDLVLLDVVMPGMDGAEVCRRIKADSDTQDIPVVMMSAGDRPDDRARGREAGADDFLTKPVGDIALFCRVKSLVRLKMLTDELRLRAGTKDHAGASGDVLMDPNLERDGKILFVDAGRDLFDRISEAAGLPHSIALVTDPHRAITEVAEGAFELVVINLESQKFDGVRLCAQLRSIEKTRHIPILVIVESDNTRRLMQALDVGCNDYLRRPVDFHEFLARVKTQIKRCRCTATLRADVTQSIEFPATDPLTGLFNRRFMERRLSSLLSEAVSCGKSLGVLALDIDQFKSVNEVHGPDAGDQILRELASRMKDSIGHLDLACRTGGEEFVIVVPNADVEEARAIAERLRNRMGTQPFSACAAMSNRIDITVSIGVAMIDGVEDSPEKLLKRADAALYRAKRAGRNQIDVAAA